MAANINDTIRCLETTIKKMPRMKIVVSRGNYLRAEATSMLFRFVDDIEFLIDPELKTVRFRSASRAGKYDLGANRKRMVAMKELYVEEL